MNTRIWNNNDRPPVRINWDEFVANDFPTEWKQSVEHAVINAYTRWFPSGVSCRYRFEGYTTRTSPNAGEILVTANQRHATTSRLASTFSSGNKVSVVVHRRNGSNPSFPLWPWVPHNAVAGQIDLQAVLTHELGHCFHLDDLSNGGNTMVGAHEYSRQRFGPWPGDVQDVKGLYSDADTIVLRALRSADGVSWSPHPARLTQYNHPAARTLAAPAAAGHGQTGRLLTLWTAVNQRPSFMPDGAATAGTPPYTSFGGEQAVHGPGIAVARDGTALWAWANADDDGTMRVARSTDGGDHWQFVSVPTGAATAGTIGIAASLVDGRAVWMLAWSHFGRATAAENGELRVSVSTDNGNSWTAPINVGPSYRSLSGVGLAASPDNRFLLVFSWAGRQLGRMNLVRSLELTVVAGAARVGRATKHRGLSRVQPAVVHHPRTNRFVMVYREQNYLTSLRVTRRHWGGTGDWPQAQQIPVTSHTAPGLGIDPRSGDIILWYGSDR